MKQLQGIGLSIKRLTLEIPYMTFAKILLICCSFSSVSIEATTEQTLTSPETQVNLLELYTSQGCSSCPPADKWVSNLKQDDRLWNSIIPIAFHVNYWDYIGWKDKFASRQYSHRHRKHARDGNIGSVYTPGFVLNGKEWRSFFGYKQFQRTSHKNVGVLKVVVNKSKLNASFQPVNKIKDELILNIVLLGFDLSSEVNAGENKGRTLNHDFVALGYKKVRLNSESNNFITSTTLPTSKKQVINYGIAAWVSKDDDLIPIQAVGGYLKN